MASLGTFSIITSVFFWLIFRRTCHANMLRWVVFSCMCWWLCETSTRSSAKSRSRRGSIWCPLVGPMLSVAASPSHRQVEEQPRHRASLSITGPHTKLSWIRFFPIYTWSCCGSSWWSTWTICLSLWSTASEIHLMMSLARILLERDRRVTPLKLLQSHKAPFFGIFPVVG